MMVRAATGPYETGASDEVYARSTLALQWCGELALNGAAEVEQAVAQSLITDNLECAVAENLRSLPEVSTLDVERVRTYRMQDGEAVTRDGTSMLALVEAGKRHAESEAEKDPRMSTQAHRDEGDVLTAKAANALGQGQTLLAISLPPLDGLRSDPGFWHGRLGYDPGLAYIQTYYKTEDGRELIASSFSVSACDPLAWQKLLQHYGVEVPDGTSADDFIRHHAVLDLSESAAIGLASGVRDQYYQLVGASQHRESVTEYLERHQATVTHYEQYYLVPLAQAIASGKNHPALQSLARGLLQTDIVDRFKPEIAQAIKDVARDDVFPRSAGSAMEGFIRYALVERLREGLLAKARGQDVPALESTLVIDYRALHMTTLSDITAGVRAGRSYAGCAASDLLNQSPESGDEKSRNSQEAFGGLGDGAGEDDGIPAIIRCKVCRKSSPRAMVIKKDSWRCPHCTYEVNVCNGEILHKSNEKKPTVRGDIVQKLLQGWQMASAVPPHQLIRAA